MNNTTKKGIIAVLVIVLVLLVDQVSKIWVKTNMALYDMIHITDWFKIHFVENSGMAFGLEAEGTKLYLTLFRIIAAIAITFYLTNILKKGYKLGFVVCIALVLAGASGNIIDSVFYGKIFEASYEGYIASRVPWGEGYTSLFHGKVVDMFYFPIWTKILPDGSEKVYFFRFIFNVADSAISVGVALLLIFYRKTLSYSLLSKKDREKLDRERQEQLEKEAVRES